MAGTKKQPNKEYNSGWGGSRSNSGRPKKKKEKVQIKRKSNFPVHMSTEERKKLEDYAWNNRKSMNQVIRDLINTL